MRPRKNVKASLTDEEIQDAVRRASASLAIENMPLSVEEKQDAIDCLSGRMSVSDLIEKAVSTHKKRGI